MDVISKIRSVTQKFHQNKFDSVIKECKKIIDIDPGNIFILNLCGLALQNTGNFLKSIDYFEKVINLDSRHLPAINNLANSYKNLEDARGAPSSVYLYCCTTTIILLQVIKQFQIKINRKEIK